MNQPISITKTSDGILSAIGLKRKAIKEVLRINKDGILYNSTLGNVGEIKADMIDLIELSHLRSSKVIKIGLINEYKIKFKYKLNKFRQGVSDLYFKETGAEILIFPQDTDIDITELAELLKENLNK